MNQQELNALTAFCKCNLPLANATLSKENFYSSLPLCVIDAIFSIGVTYTSTQNTVNRFCRYFSLEPFSWERPPAIADQLSIRVFTGMNIQTGIEEMAEKVYGNRQRTSAKNGILKAEAVLRFCRVLSQFGVDYFQDIAKVMGNEAFETAIRTIPGQGSGVSLQYFYMLAGSDALVKPDRMVLRFMENALGRTVGLAEAQTMLSATTVLLTPDYPALTTRLLDHTIWQWQRSNS